MAERDLEKHAQSLASLVEYQAGSVVSRTILNKPAGTVTLFAFDQGESLSEHTTPYEALILSLDGEMEISIAGERQQVVSGEVLIMPANRPHAIRATSPSKMLLVMIRD